jgi:hypothetical protein
VHWGLRWLEFLVAFAKLTWAPMLYPTSISITGCGLFKGSHRQLLCWPAPLSLVLVSQISCPIRIQGESFPCGKDTAALESQLQDALNGLINLAFPTPLWRHRERSEEILYAVARIPTNLHTHTHTNTESTHTP